MKSSSPRMAPTERAAAQRRNVFSIHGTHWIPSEQIECRRVRTASEIGRAQDSTPETSRHQMPRYFIKKDCRDPVATACRRVRTASGSDRNKKPTSNNTENQTPHYVM